LDKDETYGLKSIGFHTTASGRKYDLQFSPDGKFAQAVLIPVGVGAGHVVLAFRAESEEEALNMLVEELDSGSH
jgi:hypothetical protein